MLPEKIELCYNCVLSWKNETPENHPLHYIDTPVLDTELLHLCWLVEEGLSSRAMLEYIEWQTKLFDPNDFWPEIVTVDKAKLYLHATWQQRTIALAKVKGVEIV